MKRITTLFSALLMVLGLSLTTVACPAPAQAAAAHHQSFGDKHNGKFSQSCAGIQINADSYDSGATNVWSVTRNGKTKTGTFGAAFSHTFPVSQHKPVTWSAYVEAEDGSYHYDASGVIENCAPPVAEPRQASVSVGRYCNGVFVEEIHNATFTKTEIRPGMFRIVAVTKTYDGVRAEFSDGSTRKVIVKSVKRFGCGGGSDSRLVS